MVEKEESLIRCATCVHVCFRILMYMYVYVCLCIYMANDVSNNPTLSTLTCGLCRETELTTDASALRHKVSKIDRSC